MKAKVARPATLQRFIIGLSSLSVVSLLLLAWRVLESSSFRYVFLVWNLALAILPLLLAWWLVERVKRHGWLQWQQILLSVTWVLFLPNSFYIITDLVHLRQNYEADIYFDIALLTSFIVSGLVYGFVSVYLVHNQLRQRLSGRLAYGLVALLFLAVSFAICLGRYTRWNTWDVLLRPAGLLFDVSERVVNPDAHLQTYQTTLVLFLVLFGMYVVIYEAGVLLRAARL